MALVYESADPDAASVRALQSASRLAPPGGDLGSEGGATAGVLAQAFLEQLMLLAFALAPVVPERLDGFLVAPERP